jgi:surface polysaccharide O-acyltransferase-like enzyme
MIINKGYLNSLNWFRGLAILFVVLTHVDSGSLNSNIAQYIKTFVGNGTFYFVFISGYLFFHLIHKYSYLDYLRKKFLYVLIPYVFILSISILIFFQDYKFINYYMDFYYGGGFIYPLWFIPMMLIIFISTPLIKYISERKFFYLVFIVFLLINLTSFRPSPHIYPIYSAFHFLGVFFLGIYAKKQETYIYNNSLKLLTLLFFLFLVTFYLDTVLVQDYKFWPIYDLIYSFNSIINWANVSKLIMSFLFLVFFFYIEKKYSPKIVILDLLAKYSFSIFFIHGVILKAKKEFVQNGYIANDYLNEYTYYMDFIIIIIISLAISLLFKILFKNKSRYLIGS